MISISHRTWILFLFLGISHVLCAEQAPASKAISLNSSVFAVESHLAEEVSVVSQDSSRDVNKIFITRTVLKNETSESVDIQVQTFFKNTQGQTVEVSLPKNLTFKPHQEKTYVSLSTKQEIGKFLVYLKPFYPQVVQLPSPLLLEVKKEIEAY